MAEAWTEHDCTQLADTLARRRMAAFAGIGLGLTMGLQMAAATVFVLMQPSPGIGGPPIGFFVFVGGFAALNLLGAFLLASAEAAGGRARDPETLRTAITLRACGVAALASASPSWAIAAAILSMAAVIPDL